MSNLSTYVSVGGSTGGTTGFKPFIDLGTVTGVVNLDVSQYGSFRIVQGAGDITLNVTGLSFDTAGYVELFFYRNVEYGVTFSGIDLVDNEYIYGAQTLEDLDYSGKVFSVAGEDTNPYDTTISYDGTKLYMLGFGGKAIYQYTMSTPFDVSTATYDNVSLAVGDAFPYTVSINNDGTRIYYVGGGADLVYQYNLSVPLDLTTATSAGSLDPITASPYSSTFSSDGSKLFVVDYINAVIYQYSVSTPFELSTATYDSVSLNISTEGQAVNVAFNSDGSKLYTIDSMASLIYNYTLTTPFDLSTASYDEVSTPISQDSGPTGIDFSKDETIVYIHGRGSDRVYQYDPTYSFGPHFVYAITHIGNQVTLKTVDSEFSIEVAGV